jgi:hypothetical protein
MARFGQTRGDGDGRQGGCGGEQLQSGHHDSPVSLLKTKTFWPGWAPSYPDWPKKCGKMAISHNFQPQGDA